MREEATSLCVIIQESLELIPGVSLSAMPCPYSQLLRAAYIAVKGFIVLLAINNACHAVMAAQFQDYGVLLRLQNSLLHTEHHAQLD